jgi:GNAT superfamily N-acetyltransferase
MTGHAMPVVFEDENEDRFELPGGIAYATVTDQGHQVWILELWVQPGQRGHGHAATLLEAVISHYPGRVLALSAEPFGEVQGLSATQIAGWYARHGFRRWDGHLMTRPGGHDNCKVTVTAEAS